MNLKSKKLIEILIYLTAITPIVFAPRFSFPYITVRTVFFRCIIEIIILLFLWFYIKGNFSFNSLRKNYFFWSFAGLLIIEFIAAVNGESFLASIFGDLERMWGIFTVLHLFLFYLILRSFFKEKEWIAFFHVSIFISLLVSVYGIIQRFPEIFNIYVLQAGIGRITSTLGNPTYVAIYLLFNIAFCLYLLARNIHRPIKYFYLIAVIIDFTAFTLTDIKGAYLGMVMGVAIAIIFYIILGKNKKLRISFSLLILLGIIIGLFSFLNSDNRIVQKIPVLNRLSLISLTAPTTKTRFMSWNAAWQGIKERPILGVGMENFNIVFNDYFQAEYYDLAPTETYFDRAHNQFINITSESGILALIFYLGFPFFIGYYLIKGYKEGKFNLNSFLILGSITIAYFIHLFFVFDDINSFIFFIALIAFIEYSYRSEIIIIYNDEDNKKNIGNNKKVFAVIIIALTIISIYSYNYKILQAARISARGLLSSKMQDRINYLEKTLDLNIVPQENITVAYADYLISLSDRIEQISQDKEAVNLISNSFYRAEKELEQEINKRPNDAFLYYKIGHLRNAIYLFNEDEKYLEKAIDNLEKAIDLSPERLQFYYVLSESYVFFDKIELAKEILEKALELSPQFRATNYFLGRVYLTNNEIDKAYDYLMNKSVLAGYALENDIILLALAQSLAKYNQYDKVIKVFNEIIKIKPKDSQVLASLAAAYVQVDDFEKAIETAQKAIEVDPGFRQEAEYFIYLIENGQIDELKEMTK
ncbi:MAG: O-antigen ligase family protein [Patescibacteria group bacterium]